VGQLDPETVKISQFAKTAGVGIETVRYYQRLGLLSKPKRSTPYREYGADDVQRLRFIRRAQTLGFSLAEVSLLLSLSASECEDVERIARERLAGVSEKIADLRRVQAVLSDVIERCSAREAYEGCPIIETLARD
jgi:Hg(II)-responsive transcriptional regulator